MLHTSQSLKMLLKKGFKNIRVEYYQRYGFTNHMRWFLEKNLEGMTYIMKIILMKKLILIIKKSYKKIKKTDTLIAVAGI